ncbi:MAG: glycosyltransferase family 39 protein [Isosphaeraceae bacterium]|nr:glycosyltransferase family 39 protein [Isosphaeraceae bacterium]
MLDLAFVLLLSLWAAGLGLWILQRFVDPSPDALETVALAFPLGLGALGLAALGLGECSVLNRAGLAVVAIVGAWLGGRAVRRWRVPHSDESNHPPWTAVDHSLACLLVLTLLGSLLTALAPVTDGDALCYHLQVPKVFLAQGALVFDPDLHETVYPLLAEMLYAVGLAFRGPVSCRLIQWVLGLVFALNVTALARPSLGRRAWWAGAIALLVPAVSNGMSAPLNDVALAAFGTAALVAWSGYRERPSVSRVLLVGACAGLALGVKYPALVLAGLIALAILVCGTIATPIAVPNRPCHRAVLARRPHRLSHVFLFGLTAVLVGGPWYLRAAAATGNPVYPFFRHTFGGAGLDEVLDPIKRPLAVTGWNLLTALGPLTLHPHRFDSFSHQFGPVFLLFLPALFVERPPRRVWEIAAVGYAFLTLCLSQRQSMRFVLLALGPLAVATAWLLSVWCDRRSVPARCLVGLVLLSLTFEAGLALVRARHGLGVVTGRETAQDYLARREPTYRVGAWVARNVPVSARLIGQDHRGYYIPRPYTMELAHRRRTGLGRQGEPAETVVSRLRMAGFSHVLLCPPIPEDAVEFDPTLGRILASWVDAKTPLYREDLTDADGVVRRYALYRLDDSESVAQVGRPERGRE